MRDQHGRAIDYARLSITDRCNLRCQYCMPAEGLPEKKEHAEILSYEDFLRLAAILVDLGVVDFKVTGGEPLVRLGAVDFIADLKTLPGVRKVSLTTNGILLERYAEDLLRAGIDGINVSLDSLDPDRYAKIVRHDGLDKVLAGLDALLERGFQGLKINSLPLRGVNEEDLVPLAGLAKDRPIHVRFIELMPIGLGAEGGGMDPTDVLAKLEAAYGPSTAFHGKLGQGPATYVSFEGFQGKIGFIAALHDKFCDSCNRIRITSQGVLKACLQYQGGVDLKTYLDGSDADLSARIEQAIFHKPSGHAFGSTKAIADREVLGMDELGG